MKKRSNFKCKSIWILLLLIVFQGSCKKEDFNRSATVKPADALRFYKAKNLNQKPSLKSVQGCGGMLELYYLMHIDFYPGSSPYMMENDLLEFDKKLAECLEEVLEYNGATINNVYSNSGHLFIDYSSDQNLPSYIKYSVEASISEAALAGHFYNYYYIDPLVVSNDYSCGTGGGGPPPLEEPDANLGMPTISESTDIFTVAGRIIGETEDRNNTEDLQYGTDGDVTGISPEVLNESDEELLSRMRGLFGLTSTNALQNAGYAFIDEFNSNTSNTTIHSSPAINNAVKEHDSFKGFLQDFANSLQSMLIVSNGSIEGVQTISMYIRPKFDNYQDLVNGLQILINDTEKTEIRLVNYEVQPTGKWIAYIETTIYDHFGLDKHDALTYQGYHFGFAAWWILQHKRNKVPFITKVVLRHTIEGRYK